METKPDLVDYILLMLSNLHKKLIEAEHSFQNSGKPNDPDSFYFYEYCEKEFDVAKADYEETFDQLRSEVDKSFPGAVDGLFKVHQSGLITYDAMLKAIADVVVSKPSGSNIELPGDL